MAVNYFITPESFLNNYYTDGKIIFHVRSISKSKVHFIVEVSDFFATPFRTTTKELNIIEFMQADLQKMKSKEYVEIVNINHDASKKIHKILNKRITDREAKP